MRELSGKSEARGRNGWFAPRQLSVWLPFYLFKSEDSREITVEIYSKQIGSYAPITLKLTIEDAKILAGEITNAIVDAENPVAAESVEAAK